MRNLGKIGYSSYCYTECGEIYSLKVNRILKGYVCKHGYRMYCLVDDNNKSSNNLRGHILIARAFVDGYFEGAQVNHKNGDKLDNRISNLEWVTPSENMYHANRTGLRKPTMLRSENKVLEEELIIHDWKEMVSYKHCGEEEVHQICKLLEEGYRVCDVSRMTGFDRRFCQKVRDREQLKWRHITTQYDFSKISRMNRTSPEKVLEICRLLEKGVGVLEISRQLKVDRKVVGNIRNRKTFKDLSKSFDF